MTLLLTVLMLGFFAHFSSGASAQDRLDRGDVFAPETAGADQLWANGQFEAAREQYARLRASLPPGSRAQTWAEFRALDSEWRSLAKANQVDGTKLERAREALEQLIDRFGREEERDRIWAEAQESLGDFYWQRERNWNFHAARNHYDAALGYWGQAEDLERARRRFLDIVFRMAAPEWAPDLAELGNYGNWPSLERVEQAARIAQEPPDQAIASYLWARSASRSSSSPATDQRALEAFDRLQELPEDFGIGELGLWFEAEWLLQQGLWARDENGNPTREPNPVAALELYRDLKQEYPIGKGRFAREARERIDSILAEELAVHVGRAFAPGSRIEIQVHHKNLDEARLVLTAVDLFEDLRFTNGEQSSNDWLAQLETKGLEPTLEQSIELEDDGQHRSYTRLLAFDAWLEAPLAAGAYLLELRSGDLKRRELILVTDAALQTEVSGSDVYLWATRADSGQPLVEAQVQVWARQNTNPGVWQEFRATTDARGLAHVVVPRAAQTFDFFASVRSGEHQAFLTSYAQYDQPSEGWRIYAITDRPAYRPNQEVQWQLTARRFTGLDYTTPAGASLNYTLTGPRGEDLEQGKLQLNEFGSVSGSFETTTDMALGIYTIQFRTEQEQWIGNAQLFRLEEYKLPEFEVTVRLPENEQGEPPTYVLGDTIEAQIEAQTYFGAPVAGGEVEVVVKRRPYYGRPTPRGEFAWFRTGLDQENNYRGYGWNPDQEILRRELVTDAQGRATVSFDTPFIESQEFVYTIEARVVDAARREVTGRGQVNVRRQAYSVEVLPKSKLVEPGARAQVDFLAKDANDRPVAVTGRAYLYRATWREVWIDPIGVRVSGDELEAVRSRLQWPPPGWQQLVAEYDLENVESVELSTSDDGRASWSPTLTQAGTYQVRWISQDERSGEVVAQDWIYACDATTRRIGYSAQGLELILDETTFAEGRLGQVMVVTDASDRWVWLRVAGERLIDQRVLHLDGEVQLVSYDVDSTWVPNVRLQATEVRNRQLRTAFAEVVVPPVQHFLEISADLDEAVYRPGQTGKVDVTVTDHAGQPVRTELALSIFDASVAAIQSDLAGDPRQFFYGHRRHPRVAATSSLEQRPLVMLELRGPSDGAPSGNGDDDYRLGKRFNMERADASILMAEAHSSADFGNLEALGYMDSDAAPMAKAGISEEGATAQGAVVVRSDFRETAVWLPNLITDEQGRASAQWTFPESTTRWKLVARGHTTGSSFGEITEDAARTSLPLVLRLSRPRFLVVGDEATLSVVLDNTTDAQLEAALQFRAKGLTVLGWIDAGALRQDAPLPLLVPPHGSARRDFRVRAEEAGQVELYASATAGDVADAIELKLPVEEHGIEVLVADAGRLIEERIQLEFVIPPARAGSIDLRVAVSPSLATTMLDALPYLTRYPYGCLEQTLSRFVPTAVAMATLERLGLDPHLVAAASFGGVEAAHAAKTHPEGRRDFERYQDAAAEGLAKVLSWQRSDGAWAWFQGGTADEWMTAYALWSLTLAGEAKMDVPSGALLSAAQWIDTRLVEARARPNDQAWLLHSQVRANAALGRELLSEFGRTAFDHLFENRTGLSSVGVALMSLTAHAANEPQRAADFAALLTNGVTRVEEPGSSQIGGPSGGRRLPLAHWGSPGRILRWSDGAIEATSFALSALLAVDPSNELVVPAMTWLVKNRRGAQWNSTRDTAICVLSLCDYLEVSSEAREGVGFRVLVDGNPIGEASLSADDLLAPTTFQVEGATSGTHSISIERSAGSGPLYWTVAANFFSTEEPVEARASDLFVRRDYFRLRGRPTLLGGKVFERIPLHDGEQVQSGERVEVVVTLETKVALEYLLVEDLKPAGLEATELQSGTPFYATQLSLAELEHRFGEEDPANLRGQGDQALRTSGGLASLWVYRELRDRKLCMFVDKLPEGAFEMRYVLRAETPGEFHALPAIGQAMYVPEIRGNSNEVRLTVLD